MCVCECESVWVCAHRALDLEKRKANGSLPRLRRPEDEILERFADFCVAARVGIREVI